MSATRPIRMSIASLLTTTVWVICAATASVAEASAVPPQPGNLSRSPHVLVGMLIMFVLFAAVVTISLMPSKRGHQD